MLLQKMSRHHKKKDKCQMHFRITKRFPKIATVTVCKPPETNNNSYFPNIDILDFVPLENNTDNFDLSIHSDT